MHVQKELNTDQTSKIIKNKREFKKAVIEYINKTIQKGFDENNCKPFWSM